MDKNELNAMLVKREVSKQELADALGINESTLYRKLRGESEFTLSEISHIRRRLNLSTAEMNLIFFNN